MQSQVKLQKTGEKTYSEAKKKTNKVLLNIFRGFEVTRKGTIDVVTAKESMKSKYNTFSGYNKIYVVCLVYLKLKLQQDSYGWCNFKLKS